MISGVDNKLSILYIHYYKTALLRTLLTLTQV